MNIYDILINIWKRERAQPNLQDLDLDFYQKCRDYINHLEQHSEEEKDDLLAKLFQKRWIRTTFVINDLLNLRTKKIIELLINGKSLSSSLASEELELKNKIERDVGQFKNKILGIVEMKDDQELPEEDGYKIIKFTTEETIQSIGSDLRTYGPFKKDDIAIVPSDNASNFFKRSKAELLDIDLN